MYGLDRHRILRQAGDDLLGRRCGLDALGFWALGLWTRGRLRRHGGDPQQREYPPAFDHVAIPSLRAASERMFIALWL